MSKRRVLAVFTPTPWLSRRAALGVAAYAQEHGRWELLVRQDPQVETIPLPEDLGADGAIVMQLPPAEIARFAGSRRPVVGIEIYSPHALLPVVGTDNRAVGEMAADYFLSLGYRRFGYVPSGRVPVDYRQERYVERIEQAGGTASVLEGGARLRVSRWEEVMDRLTAWLMRLMPPVAILAANDEIALVVVEACERAGMAVPEQVAVLGVHDDDVFCAMSPVALSSISLAGEEVGRRAAELLDAMMDGGSGERSEIVIKPRGVVARRSTDFLAIDEDVAAAVRWIRGHYAEAITPQAVADRLAISRSALDRRFKRLMFRTLHEEIAVNRIARAKELLTSTDLPLREVARRSGFATREYMSSVLHKATGQWPAGIRRGVGAAVGPGRASAH